MSEHKCGYCKYPLSAFVYDGTKIIKPIQIPGLDIEDKSNKAMKQIKELTSHLSHLWKTKQMQFPYKRYIYSITTLRQNIAKFSSELPYWFNTGPYVLPNVKWTDKESLGQLTIYKPCNTPLTIICHPGWYGTYHVIADSFSEHIRLQGRRKYLDLNPIQYWSKNNTFFIEKTLTQNKGKINAYLLRESLYPQVKECENFKASLAYLVYTRLFPGTKTVLDPCAGWGDRLIAAIAAGVEYTGVDPNTKLTPCYREMIDNLCLSPEQKTKYTMIESCFLTAALPSNIEYDLVYCCMPYFDLELYSEEKTQSVVQFPTLAEWKKGFLFPLLAKSWQHLKKGGNMVMVINDFNDCKTPPNTDKHTYCQDMVTYCVNELEDCSFQGVVSYSNGTSNIISSGNIRQPMWIFLKS